MGWFSAGLGKFLVWSKESISLWVEDQDMETHSNFRTFLHKAVYAFFISFLVLGGGIVGGVIGGIKGYSSSIGLVRGAAIGAMAAAISLIQLMEFIAHGEPFSKLGFLCSLFDGKNFNEWVNPFVLKAYQWMMEPLENNVLSFDEDIDQYHHFDYDLIHEGRAEMKGLSADYIDNLPKYKLITTSHLKTLNFANNHNNIINNSTTDANRSLSHTTSCPICLENLSEGEVARKLPTCDHSFHIGCIDQWLRQCGSCPLCRQQLDP